jgi:hypothetical protein
VVQTLDAAIRPEQKNWSALTFTVHGCADQGAVDPVLDDDVEQRELAVKFQE